MKLKRELGTSDPSEVLADSPRTKRPKRGSSVASPSANEDVDMADGDSSSVIGADIGGGESVRELGLKIFNAVKNAKGKDDRVLSHDFMRLPSKRQYADYYNLIKRPIALDEIKAQLDSAAYPSIEAVKQDFDTCFKNAKRYNMPESQIWKDAKTLHKIVAAEYKVVTGVEEDVDVIGSDGGGDGSDPDEEKERIPKGRPGRPPSLNRLLKTRMQKLVDKTDDTGRLMTEDFMELPSRKLYPIYYKTIKKLMCFDAIFKKIKRKEYATSAEFAADVELVFSNAVTFNEEHSPIWEDAVALKEYFRHLMSDLPTAHALPEYSGIAHRPPVQNGKLKLRVPAPSQANAKVTSPSPGNVSLTVKLPAPASASLTTQQQTSSSRQVPAAAKQPAVSKSPKVTTRTPLHAQSALQAPSSYLHPTTPSHVHAHQPQPQHHHNSQATSQTNSATHSISPSPLPTPTSPTVTYDHPLHSLILRTMPLGRTLRLHASEGVRTWVLRLGKGETTVIVSDVRFSEAEESEDDEDEEESNSGAGKGEVVVKVNGKNLNAKVPNEKEGKGIWQVSELKSGPNMLEVGEKDGEIWKVILQRIGIVV